MPVGANGVGVSAETAQKQADLEYVLDVMLRVAKSPNCMGAAWSHPFYEVFDLNSGPGIVDGAWGSPLIIVAKSFEWEVPLNAHFFDLKPQNCNGLESALVNLLTGELMPNYPHRFDAFHASGSCCDCDECSLFVPALYHNGYTAEQLGYAPDRTPHYGEWICDECAVAVAYDWMARHIEIIPGDHKLTAPPVIDRVRRSIRKKWVYGLGYGDGNGELDTPLAPMLHLARCFKRLDLLLNVSANGHKRVRKAFPGRPYLLDALAPIRIQKPVGLIREVRSDWEWTMLYMTNWEDPPKMRSAGFYPIDSPKGRELAAKANFTRAERRDMQQRGLFDDLNGED